MAQIPLAIDRDVPRTLTLNLRSIELTDEQFHQLGRDNPDLRFELTAGRELVIKTPTGSKTGWRNSKLTRRLANWAEEDGTGLSFDSSTGFSLANGAKRLPRRLLAKARAVGRPQPEAAGRLCPALSRFRRRTPLARRPSLGSPGQDGGVLRERRSIGMVD